MKKVNKLITLIAIPFLGFSLNASDLDIKKDEKILYVNVETKAGQEILKSENDYKDYLNKKLAIDNSNKQNYENYDDLQKLKKAVAKLILDKSNIVSSEEINRINLKIENLNTENKQLKLEINSLKNELEQSKSGKVFLLNKVSKDEIKPVEHKIKNEMNDSFKCKYNVKSFDKPVTFTVQYKQVSFFDKPELNIESIGKKMKGETFVATKYNTFGWVYSEEYGWAKGYLLSPIFMPSENCDINKK